VRKVNIYAAVRNGRADILHPAVRRGRALYRANHVRRVEAQRHYHSDRAHRIMRLKFPGRGNAVIIDLAIYRDGRADARFRYIKVKKPDMFAIRAIRNNFPFRARFTKRVEFVRVRVQNHRPVRRKHLCEQFFLCGEIVVHILMLARAYMFARKIGERRDLYRKRGHPVLRKPGACRLQRDVIASVGFQFVKRFAQKNRVGRSIVRRVQRPRGIAMNKPKASDRGGVFAQFLQYMAAEMHDRRLSACPRDRDYIFGKGAKKLHCGFKQKFPYVRNLETFARIIFVRHDDRRARFARLWDKLRPVGIHALDREKRKARPYFPRVVGNALYLRIIYLHVNILFPTVYIRLRSLSGRMFLWSG